MQWKLSLFSPGCRPSINDWTRFHNVHYSLSRWQYWHLS